MNSQNVESIFSAALEITSAVERSAYLDDACQQDVELRKRVELLLEAQGEFGSFMQQPAVDRDVTLETVYFRRIGPHSRTGMFVSNGGW